MCSVEGLQACDGFAQDECVDVVCSLVRVDRLQVHHVTDHMILITHTIACTQTHSNEETGCTCMIASVHNNIMVVSG